MIMRHPEDLLPHDMSFDSFVADVSDEVRLELEEIQAEYGDIIDLEYEFSRDVMQIWRLSGFLANAMKSETEPVDAVQKVMYRGMWFALQVVEQIRSADIKSVPLSSVIPLSEGIAPEDEVYRQTSRYLSERRHIGDLISNFMPELDDTFLYHHHVETAASLMFMLCERQQAEELLVSTIEDVTLEQILED